MESGLMSMMQLSDVGGNLILRGKAGEAGTAGLGRA